MVIKRSPGGEFAGGGRSTWKSTCEVPGWLHLAIDQHPVCPNLAPAWTLTSEFDRINWPLTSEMFTFWICTRVLQWSCLKAVSVSTFVLALGGLRGFTATSDLVKAFCLVKCFDESQKNNNRRLVKPCLACHGDLTPSEAKAWALDVWREEGKERGVKEVKIFSAAASQEERDQSWPCINWSSFAVLDLPVHLWEQWHRYHALQLSFQCSRSDVIMKNYGGGLGWDVTNRRTFKSGMRLFLSKFSLRLTQSTFLLSLSLSLSFSSSFVLFFILLLSFSFTQKRSISGFRVSF